MSRPTLTRCHSWSQLSSRDTWWTPQPVTHPRYAILIYCNEADGMCPGITPQGGTWYQRAVAEGSYMHSCEYCLRFRGLASRHMSTPHATSTLPVRNLRVPGDNSGTLDSSGNGACVLPSSIPLAKTLQEDHNPLQKALHTGLQTVQTPQHTIALSVTACNQAQQLHIWVHTGKQDQAAWQGRSTMQYLY
jgi:hypothetical protein